MLYHCNDVKVYHTTLQNAIPKICFLLQDFQRDKFCLCAFFHKADDCIEGLRGMRGAFGYDGDTES